MNDLQRQLASRFGAAAPEPAAPAAADDDPLADGAWRQGPWLPRLRALHRATPGAPKLADSPSLGNQRQVTDQLVKLLRKAGKRREADELADLAASFLARRDRAAWAALKAAFAARDLPERAYRRLKSEEVDPVAAWDRLRRADDAALAGVGADRLYGLLTGAGQKA